MHIYLKKIIYIHMRILSAQYIILYSKKQCDSILMNMGLQMGTMTCTILIYYEGNLQSIIFILHYDAKYTLPFILMCV